MQQKQEFDNEEEGRGEQGGRVKEFINNILLYWKRLLKYTTTQR